MRLFKITEQIAYYLVPLILIILSLTIGNQDFFEEIGGFAEMLVIIILFMKPIGVIFASKTLMKLLIYRRTLGVSAFWVALFHGGGLFFVMGLTDVSLYTDFSDLYFWGLLALIGMTILAITSNDFSVRLLKRNWKKLQYIVYPTFFLIELHVGLAEGSLIGFYILVIAFIILKTLEWKKITIKSFSKKNK